MGRKNKAAAVETIVTEETANTTKGGVNKSAGVERPFKARNLKRLTVIAGYFKSMINDLNRAGDGDEWVRAAKSAAGDADTALGEMSDALNRAPDGYATRKASTRKAATAEFTTGGTVNLTEAGYVKYDATKVGEIGAVGTILDIQVGGLLVQFPGNAIPQFVRGAHLVKAE